MSVAEWFEDEQSFAQQLARGRRGEFQIAASLLPLGKWLRVGPLEFRENVGDPHFKDQKDLEVEGGHLLEVKSRGIAFTSPEDFPYPTALVGTVSRWRKRAKMPCVVISLSELTGEFVVASTAYMDQWVTEETWDSHRGIRELNLAVPKRLLLPSDQLHHHLSRPCRGVKS